MTTMTILSLLLVTLYLEGGHLEDEVSPREHQCSCVCVQMEVAMDAMDVVCGSFDVHPLHRHLVGHGHGVLGLRHDGLSVLLRCCAVVHEGQCCHALGLWGVGLYPLSDLCVLHRGSVVRLVDGLSFSDRRRVRPALGVAWKGYQGQVGVLGREHVLSLPYG